MSAVTDLSNGASRHLWEIHLDFGRKATEERLLFWSEDVDAVNAMAIGLWPELASSVPCGGMSALGCEDNVDGSKTRKGQPYTGFATLGHGQASCFVSVSRVVASAALGYPANLVEQALASRNLSRSGSRDDLARRLNDYILYPSEEDSPYTLWKCVQEEGVDICPFIDTEGNRGGLNPEIGSIPKNYVVKASQERIVTSGKRFLRLADGSGWLPTATPDGRALFTREQAKTIDVKIETPGEWSREGLCPKMHEKRVWPGFVVEAYIEGADGERREGLWLPQRPLWESTRVDSMDFPLTLTFLEQLTVDDASFSSKPIDGSACALRPGVPFPATAGAPATKPTSYDIGFLP